MTQEYIKQISRSVYSRILMREHDMKEFESWLADGNYDEEFSEAEIICCKGLHFDFKEFAMAAFNKFNS